MPAQVSTSTTVRPIEAASAAISDAIIRARSERWERLQLERLLHRTDRLLEEIEQLNLGEVRRLPAGLKARVSLLLSTLPFDFEPTITASPTPTVVLDVIFDLQELIFELKAGRPLEELDDDESTATSGSEAINGQLIRTRPPRKNGETDESANIRDAVTACARPADAVGGHAPRDLAGGEALAVRRPHRPGRAKVALQRPENRDRRSGA